MFGDDLNFDCGVVEVREWGKLEMGGCFLIASWRLSCFA